ncbi:MAG: L-serine ammonia-lyase [Gammaproteobacteria bacterium RIFCSPHIGHO2_12_FULL_45_12]|nr:MAG: L-serine ammonia-lyase [Gammaproteobacteria bacterium RIFCSPHIGHO2_12_FULL_45_12]
MSISIFELFAIGIGPSSSHTVGPMKAARAFMETLVQTTPLTNMKRIQIELFGSLAFTGKGHGTDTAILLGLEGQSPDTVIPDQIQPRAHAIIEGKQLHCLQTHPIHFDYLTDFIYNLTERLPFHSNGMRFSAYNAQQNLIASDCYYSIGGGFILNEAEAAHPRNTNATQSPYPFQFARELLQQCEQHQLTIAAIMMANEAQFTPMGDIKQKLLHITDTMQQCITKGCESPGILPGGLNIKRRAPRLYQKLHIKGKPPSHEHMDCLQWLNLYAIAVNEENAAGGRIVTAPTNGAAGIIPAVLHYYLTFYPHAKREDAIDFLLTAGAIGLLYKKNASISGAEVGCQGEVGAACSMAAGALTAVLGGTPPQIENAAEIAMEHHLGMTCDPMHGLVQIPCIERNAMGAVKAVNAACLALLGDGQHFVSLDKVIATMKQTGKDMMTIYKETSQGGLAANLPEC